MSFLNSLDISYSALSAERLRMDIISQNIANQNSYNTADGDPYRRQMVSFETKLKFSDVMDRYTADRESTHARGVYYMGNNNKFSFAGVEVAEVVEDDAPFVPVYDPDNPLADEEGYIYQTNVDNTKEQIDLLAAQRSYEANASAASAIKAMLTKAQELKGR
ncbi:MAG: flagellar basal body rod protein FlgC [Oscillospiraceae bacterium]|nr:flagellar basal body rod protein FlgC [Oscillospiraceae bacterium]